MIDEFAKEYLHGDLREARETVVWKLDGLSEYDVRRPLTPTGTNLLGLVKHLTRTEARYFGDAFGRPFPEPVPGHGDDAELDADKWVTADESRDEIIDRYLRVSAHSDETINELRVDAPGHVAHWPRPDVKLFNVLVHVLTETTRHAGHMDILRETLDNAVGTDLATAKYLDRGAGYWEAHYARVEEAAKPFSATSP
ncbi:type I restriction endonuclease subunit M [Actinoalloteichus sp. AHMU CJ021]|uniref:DinB family protein n=1 Tax=Actinoalloteichus sp. AHMU CJ021 TaxID=2072503 RepID=UPI000CA06BAC|nr:type I restriction endonuclease subunit M [Actinoalloteichus sp. AHMU CJ021]